MWQGWQARASSFLALHLGYAWIVAGFILMGLFGIGYGLSPNIEVAILMVTVTGFLNSPSAVSRRLLLQKNIPREMRGRVFSTNYVLRDIFYLVGMGLAGLAVNDAILLVSFAEGFRRARASLSDITADLQRLRRRVSSPVKARRPAKSK